MANIQGSTNPVLCRMEVAPATGSTTTIVAPFDVVLYTNPGTIAAQTLVLPASPSDGQLVVVSAIAAITALTLSPVPTAGPTAMAAGSSFRLMYSSTAGWFVFA